MENGLTASDVALLNRDDGMFGGNSFMWIFALLILLFGFGGNGFGFGGRFGDYGQFATAASQQEILFGQQFQGLDNKIDRIGNGIADATYALNNAIRDNQMSLGTAIAGEGRALQTQLANCCCETKSLLLENRYLDAQNTASINATTTAQTQRILDAIAQDKIEALQSKVSALELQNAMCGVVRYPNGMTYSAGTSPFCNCGCGNI